MSSVKDIPEVLASPSYDDFCSYLPWACLQFGVPAVVTINKVIEGGPSKLYSEAKTTKGRKLSSSTRSPSVYDQESVRDSKSPKIYITASFNKDKLVGLTFEDKNKIPREVMKVIKLIIHKQIFLKRLEIKSGLDKYIIHEIGEIVKVSHLTEICLDNTFVKQGNYAVLLEAPKLNYLSLSKCKINDRVIEEICKNLKHPDGASKSLVAIVLSTNQISDDGAKFLAEALRSNRKLAYINLADNMITDDGAFCIFDTLEEFPVRREELVAAKGRRFAYLKERNSSLFKAVESLKLDDDKEAFKDEASEIVSSRKGKKQRAPKSFRSLSVATVGVSYDRSAKIDENSSENFHDPFHFPNIYFREGTAYCKGNNALRYLNLAYNDLSYMSLKKILQVLIHQKISDIGGGLVEVKLDGNNLPVDCEEMHEMDMLLGKGSPDTDSLQSKRKRGSKSSKQRRETE